MRVFTGPSRARKTPVAERKKRKYHRPEQVVKKLAEADRLLEAGRSFAQVLQVLEVSEATYHRWRTSKVSGHQRCQVHSSIPLVIISAESRAHGVGKGAKAELSTV